MWRRADAGDLCFTERFTLYLVVAVCMRVKHKVIFLKGKISLGKKKLGKIDIFFSVKKLLCLLYKVAWKGWKSWWLYPESPYYQKHQERGEKLLEFRRKLHIDLNESLLLVVFHVSWCICLWRSFFPNNFPTLCLFFLVKYYTGAARYPTGVQVFPH